MHTPNTYFPQIRNIIKICEQDAPKNLLYVAIFKHLWSEAKIGLCQLNKLSRKMERFDIVSQVILCSLQIHMCNQGIYFWERTQKFKAKNSNFKYKFTVLSWHDLDGDIFFLALSRELFNLICKMLVFVIFICLANI